MKWKPPSKKEKIRGKKSHRPKLEEQEGMPQHLYNPLAKRWYIKQGSLCGLVQEKQ
jgi:hypothetical protein